MTKEIIIDECYFCDNGTCNIYPWTCDYDWNCKDNNECKVKEIFLELQRLEQENKELIEDNLNLSKENKDFEILAKSLYKRATGYKKKSIQFATTQRVKKIKAQIMYKAVDIFQMTQGWGR